MRIRSNLTSRTLYSEAGKNTGGPERPAYGRRSPRLGQRTAHRTGAGRRVFRLCLLLVLVLLLMQQAADPQVYQRFFAVLGAPLQGPSPQAPGDPASANFSRSADSSLAASPSQAAGPPRSADSPAADASAAVPLVATVAALGEAHRDELTSVLSVHRRGGRAGQGGNLPALLEAVADAARASGEVDPERLVSALRIPPASAQPVEPAAAELPEAPQSADLQRLRDRLQAALDAHYWTSVTDATIWQPGDAMAFYRLLEMGRRRDQPALRVGYASLAEQPQVYRGRHVSLAGRAVRVEPLQAAENPFGIRSYFLVWVRPNDGSERPVMVYATEIPRGLQRLAGESNIVDGPALVAEGTFLKRHLYLSQRGSELAPVIVGAVEVEETPAAAAAVGAANVAARSWMIGVAVAVLAAVAFTLWAAWHTGRTGRWRRQIRQRGTVDPVPFLQSLDRRP